MLTSILLVLGCGLVGLASGPWFCLPFVLGLTLVGLPATILPGALLAFGLTLVTLVVLGTGVGLGVYWTDLTGTVPPLQAPDWRTSREVWTEAVGSSRSSRSSASAWGALGRSNRTSKAATWHRTPR